MIWMRKMPISLNCHCTVLCNCHFVHIVHLFIFPPPGVQSPSVFLFFLTPVFSLQGLTFSKTDHTSLFRSWFSTFSVFFKPFLILSSVLWRLAGVPHFPNFDLLTPRVAWGLSWCAPTPTAPTGARHSGHTWQDQLMTSRTGSSNSPLAHCDRHNLPSFTLSTLFYL